ncbi:hypothetical protein ValSw41_77 [Vibrio phage ValSw4_1]|nr:hypothetical protein ValSw41_77 [Vibrio phage ValSw4_1]WGH28432.1 hypothetical protein 13VO501A_gene0049 [Vibrio phage 13VO501A]
MLLASVSELRTRLNVADSERYNLALASILLNTSMRIEQHLETKFERKEFNDVFLADSSNHLVNGAAGRTQYDSGVLFLRLRGISPNNVKVFIKSTLAATGVETSKFEVYPRGQLRVYGSWGYDDYIGVSYTSGYTAKPDEDLSDYMVYQDVPILLKEACLMFAEDMFMNKYATGSNTGKKGDKDYTDPPNGVVPLLAGFLNSRIGCLEAIV